MHFNIYNHLELNDLFKFLLIYNKNVQYNIIIYLNELFKFYHNYPFYEYKIYFKNNVKEFGKLFFFKMNYLINNSNLNHKYYIDIYTYLLNIKNNDLDYICMKYIINNIHHIIHNSFEFCKRQEDPIKYGNNIMKIFKLIFSHTTLKRIYTSKIFPILDHHFLLLRLSLLEMKV